MTTRVTKTLTQKTVSTRGCTCMCDPETGLCCSTGRCGCRKLNRACTEACECFRPVCLCNDGKKLAVQREVKKEGSNQGRTFFGCGSPAATRCDFFAWAGVSRGKVLSSDSSSSSSGSRTLGSNTVDVETQWACPACTFLNVASMESCAVCGSQRSVGFDFGSSSSGSSSSSSVNRMPEFCSTCSNQFGLAVLPIRPKPRKPTVQPAGRAAGAGAKNGGGGKKRKQCERGATCPYRNEYQHGLEFSHDDEDAPAAAGHGQKRGKGGGAGGGFVPFSGVGKSLRG